MGENEFARNELRKTMNNLGLLNRFKNEEEKAVVKYNPDIEKINNPEERLRMRKLRFSPSTLQEEYDNEINHILELEKKTI